MPPPCRLKHKPETLVTWHAQADTLRRRLAGQMPALPTRNLRDCQISAVTGLERSLALKKPRGRKASETS